MRPHEAVLICGAKQYAAYTGYGGSFECAGAHDDGTGDEGSHIVALDATYYPGAEGAGQFAEAHMCRELVKLTAALADDGGEFAQPERKGGRKGKWGRGAADEGAGAATRRHPSRGRPFATGNWGCGIFGGDPPLKALLQWMVASRCGRQLIYYPFGDARVAGLAEAAEAAIRAEATVGQLAAALFDATPDELMGRDAVGGGAFDVVRAALSS